MTISTENPSRRAALGALASVPALALPLGAMAASPPLNSTDRRVLDLWKRRGRLVGIRDRFSEQRDAAEAQLPAWARSGPKYVLAKGKIPIPDDTSGWPEVADLDRQPVDFLGRVNARPRIEDLFRQYDEAAKTDHGVATRELTRSIVAYEERVRQQKAEQERVGYAQAAKRAEATYDLRFAVEEEIKFHSKASVLALGAIIMVELDDADEHVQETYRAALAAIRPALVDAIAQDADRVHAPADEESANV
jgi:hypothetical protein